MGAWGHKNFQNDDALDWVNDFDERGVVAIRSALEFVIDLPEEAYLEAPESCMALAAAEIVAAAKDGDLSGLPDAAGKAFDKHRAAIDAGRFAPVALEAVRRVLRKSELRGLWEEDIDLLSEWRQEVNRLVTRLQ